MITNPKLKKLLIKIIIAVILSLAKEYINLDNDVVNRIIIIIISTCLLDFNIFSLGITKFFNGDEGEGSNRQNNNTSNQGPSINPPSHEEGSGVVETTPDNSGVEATVEELEEKLTVLVTEQNRFINQYKARFEIYQHYLDKRAEKIDEEVREFNNMKNQSKPLEAPIMDEIERQLEEDKKILDETAEKIKDNIHSDNTKIIRNGLEIANLTFLIENKKKNKSDSK